MKTTQDVRDYAAALNEKEQGMVQMSEKFRQMGSRYMWRRRRRAIRYYKWEAIMAEVVTPGGVAMAALSLVGMTLEQLVQFGKSSEIERLEIIAATAEHLQRAGTPETKSALVALNAMYHRR
jgi:hypothetical protein